MRFENRRLIGIAFGLILVLGILSYGLFEARFLIEGPGISIEVPTNGETASSSLIEIAGVAKNISSLSLNDQAMFVDEEGHFSEHILLSYGYNVVSVKAKDRFGRERARVLEIMYQ